LQTILSKLLTYCVLRPTQPFTLSGTRNDHVAYGLWVEGQWDWFERWYVC